MSAPNIPLISVIIPCRNEAQTITDCIQAIVNNSWPHLEILVIDGMSTDHTREILKSLTHPKIHIRILDNPALFTPVAFNIGIREARGEWVQIVGARQILAPNYLQTCYQILTSSDKIACVGGITRHAYHNKTEELIAKAMMSPFGVGPGNWRTLDQEAEVDTVGTPLYRRKVLLELGGFDETLVRNQDDEINYRLRLAGYKILFTPKTSLDYYVRSSWKQLAQQYFQYGYWKTYVNHKHKSITTLRQTIPALFVILMPCGFGLSCFFPVLWYPYTAIWALYFSLGLLSAYQAQLFKAAVQMLGVFLLLHTAYGLGYLRGLVHFYLLKRQPEEKQKSLTR